MKHWIMATAVVALVAGSSAVLMQGEARAEAPVCLKIRNLGTLKLLDDRTALATSRSQGNFIVRMRGTCRDLKMIDNYYSLRVSSSEECFDSDDVLVFRYGGVCFIESVTRAPAK
ncbi:MAG: hypothetical protein ACK6A4_17280 [Alphaproteobacteria bacterium]